MGAERSAFHPGQEGFTPTKAVYICADQPATLTFRLRKGGGPYIPDVGPDRPVRGAIREKEGVLRPGEACARGDPERVGESVCPGGGRAGDRPVVSEADGRVWACAGYRRASFQRHAPHDGEGGDPLVQGNRDRPQSG